MRPVLNRMIFVAAAALLCCTAVSWQPAQASWNAANFLKFGVGARAMGMGNSFVAIADDATAVYWNPAGLSQLQENQVFMSYANRFGAGVQDQSLGLALKWRKRINVGFAMARSSVGDIKHTTDGVVDSRGRPLIDGTFDDAEVGLLFATGVQVHEIFSVGLTAKYMIHDLYDKTATGMGIDIGWMFHPLNTLSFGLNAQNINRTRMKWTTEQEHFDRIPANFKFGASADLLDSRMRVSADLNLPDFGSLGLNSGVEYSLTDYLVMRGGMERAELATGATIQFERVHIDYAYRTQELGDTHRFALSYGF